jgi:hypothetical protein
MYHACSANANLNFVQDTHRFRKGALGLGERPGCCFFQATILRIGCLALRAEVKAWH